MNNQNVQLSGGDFVEDKKVQVIKRSKWNQDTIQYENFDLKKIYNRLLYLMRGEDIDSRETNKQNRKIIKIGRELNIDIDAIIKSVSQQIKNNIYTHEIDMLCIKACIDRYMENTDYEEMAVRIYVSSLHKETPWKFTDAMQFSYCVVMADGTPAAQIRNEILNISYKNETDINKMLVFERDFNLSYFGLITIERPGGVGYLTKDINGKMIERIQHMWMRVSIEIHHKLSQGKFLDQIKITYNLLSNRYVIHGTPTLTNAGSNFPQMASCMLLQMEDSIEGIADTYKDVMVLSKNGAGIGLYMGKLRGAGSVIKSTGGKSKGLLSFIQILNSIAKSIDQGGTGRKSAVAVFLPVHHVDLIDFINLPRNNHAAEEKRARFIILWIGTR